MTPSARVAAVIELLDRLFLDKNPLDNTLREYFRKNRYIGSKDKAYISDFIYKILRNYNYLQHISNVEDGKGLAITHLLENKQNLADFFNNDKYSLGKLTSEDNRLVATLEKFHKGVQLALPTHVKYNYPKWLEKQLKHCSKQDLEILNTPAKTYIIENRQKTGFSDKTLLKYDIKVKKTDILPSCYEILNKTNFQNSEPYKNGLFDVMDLGAQIILDKINFRANSKVLDFCCGAGGKSIGIGVINPTVKIDAYDLNTARSKNLPSRVKRLGLDNIKLHTDKGSLEKSYDYIVLDVPCSGSGTWRRNPDLKHRLTEQELESLHSMQMQILNEAQNYLKEDGRIIYITCSILTSENEDMITSFVKSSDFKLLSQERISPSEYDCDGFFFAELNK